MNTFKRLLPILCLLILAIGCSQPQTDTKQDGENTDLTTFLEAYNTRIQELYYNSAEAQWKLNTKIIEGDTLTSKEVETAEKAFTNYAGSTKIIEKVTEFLKDEASLEPVEKRQLEAILYSAANNPETVKELVEKRIQADTKQTELLYGFDFKINNASVSPNELDNILKTSADLNERLAAWEASKEVGVGLKAGLDNLRQLRNQCVQALSYDDYFNYQISEYGMTTDEMLSLNRKLVNDIWPLYRELHTWARYHLSKKYEQEVPEMLPAHWLPNRWGQEWGDMLEVEGVDLDAVLSEKSAEWIVTQAEDFYVSLGFNKLPESFYEKSSLYPLPKDAKYKKNNHASAWHMNLDKDVRSLMSVEPNTRWWETTLHELGHIYYYMTYTNPDVPIVLRGGANRAFHEALGSLVGLAAMQEPFLVQYGLLEPGQEKDEIQTMLKEALNYVILMPWASGVMTEFEYELYANELPIDEFNKKWWELKARCQGIVPPSDRGENFCDAASKTHINNDAAQYYDYALSYVLLFQLHQYIAENILKQDPHATNYYGSKEVGEFVRNLMYPGANVDWREHFKQNLGEEMSAKPMMDYFAPLMDYLKKANEGKKYTLPEKYSLVS